MSDEENPAGRNLPAIGSEWIGFIKTIPGAIAALAKFVGSFGDAGSATVGIGTAKAKQASQGITDFTEGRSKVRAALVNAAIEKIGNDPDLAYRALGHFASDIVGKQENREAVTVRALENLRADPPEKPSDEPPTEDWFNVFGPYAERANSETMRNYFGKILEGEIRKPGSFSFATLHLASMIDKNTIEVIQRISPWIIEKDYIPTLGEINKGEIYTDLLFLDDIGFIKLGAGSKYYTFDPEGYMHFVLRKKLLVAKGPSGNEINIPCAFMTAQGRQLLDLFDSEQHPRSHVLMTEHLKSRGATDVQLADITSVPAV